MNNDFMDKMKDSSRQMYAPWSRFNQAMLRNAEKMTDFSLETMRHYSEMGIEQLRNVSCVDCPEAVSSFNQKQTELLNQLGQKMLSDAQRLTELGKEIRNEVMSAMNEIYSQNASSMQDAMQSAASNASKTAEDFNRKVNENMHKAANQMSEAVKQTTQNMNKAATNVTAAATRTTNDAAQTQNSEAAKPAAKTTPAAK